MKNVCALLSIALLVLGAYSCANGGKDASQSDGDAAEGDAPETAQDADCETGNWRCSEDGFTLYRCEAGLYVVHECMREEGKLCEAGLCIEPWRYGGPVWSECSDEPHATTETLSEKAAYYNDIMTRLHLHPRLGWIMPVTLPCKTVDCGNGQTPPCVDCNYAEIPQEEATWEDVERWHSGENDGLWNAHFIMAEAFRYAVTHDATVLTNLKTLLAGERTRVAVTGAPGVFTRQYIPPGVSGLTCPEDDAQYIRDVEKDDNRWVQIREDGCVWYIDDVTTQWTRSDHCGLKDYAGYCWLDNVSKDEYAGHMAAIGAAGFLVDDPEVKAVTTELCRNVAGHLIQNRLSIIDWDGRITEHGRFWAMALDDYPGFNAAMALGYVKTCATLTGDPDIQQWYEDCLLQKSGTWDCLERDLETPASYLKYLTTPGLYIGNEGCKSNYNNISMHLHSLFNLILAERDPYLREVYQQSLDIDVFRAKNQPRAVQFHNNAAYDFVFAGLKRLGPGSDGPAYDIVDNGVCMLRQFPARKHQAALACPAEKCTPYCKNRFGDDTGNYPRQVAERCMDRTFLWWADPYSLKDCIDSQRTVYPPTDYLLAYWMGRYFGFISEKM